MPRLRVALAAAGLWSLVLPGVAAAQAPSDTLVGQMFDLFRQNIVLARTPSGAGLVAHTATFEGDQNTVEAYQLISQLSQQISSQVTNLPVSSSASGFTFSYDPSLGTFNRTTETFGPAFAERAATIGKGRMSFGLNYAHVGYASMDGKSLKDGDIILNLKHQQLTPRSYVEGDVVQTSLGLDLSSDTTSLQFNYGVSNQLDLGIAVPIVHVSMDLQYKATILDFATAGVTPAPHLFPNGTKTQSFTDSGSASGIGDVVVRGKYNLMPKSAVGAAVGLDLRLPTGDENNMLGAGYAQTRLYLAISGGGQSRVLPHVNMGYTFGGSDNRLLSNGNQFNYAGGLEVALSPRVTVIGDLIGRRFSEAWRLRSVSETHTYQRGPTGPTTTTALASTGLSNGALLSNLGTTGIKLNAWGNLLVSASVLFPLGDNGLRIKPTPVIGLDYAF